MSLSIRITLPTLALLLALAWPGTALGDPYSTWDEHPAQTTDQTRGDQVVAVATTALGARYRWGGISPQSGFDCSGFLLWVYRHFDVELPRTAASQLHAGHRIAADDLRRGDIVIFQNTYRWGPSHAGIYLGEGQFIHAAAAPFGVVISSLWDGYWGPRFLAGVRPAELEAEQVAASTSKFVAV